MSKGGGVASEMDAMNQQVKGGQQTQDREVKARQYDEKQVAERMTKLNEDVRQKKEAAAKREAELNAVKVEADDIALVAAQCDITPAAAKRKLQQKNGDINAVFKDYILH